jgi:hypothetical protein
MQIEVVDNASTADDLEPLVRRVGGARVSLVRQPQNIGMFPNFNSCIERSRGEWVHILSDDDIVLPGFYERFKFQLQGRDGVGAAFCRHAFIDGNERWLRTSELENPAAGVLHDFIGKIGASQRIQLASMVVRRRVYDQVGGFRLDLPQAADWEMWIRIAAQFPIWYEPTTLAAWRVHSQSASAALLTSGQTFVDIHRCIEISRSWLPPDRAETISRGAKEWVCLLELSKTSQDEAVVGLVEELFQVSGTRPMDRIGVANELLRAFCIHYRQGRQIQALVSVSRALLTRPGILRDVFWEIFINRTLPWRKRLGLRRRKSIEQDAQRVRPEDQPVG